MKCIAIDDEPIALSIIRQFCERKGGLELETYTDPEIGATRIAECRPELVMLDIEMNGVSGLDIARGLECDTYLIFTTAHASYALEGFELNAVDFLHKPFSYDRFDKAVSKAMRIHEFRQQLKQSQSPDTKDRKINLKVEYKNVNINIDDILYIEAMDNYMKVYHSDVRPVISQISMKAIMDMLPESEFIRVHKSYIVHIDKIANYTKKQITISDCSTIIPVGRIYADKLVEIMNNH